MLKHFTVHKISDEFSLSQEKYQDEIKAVSPKALIQSINETYKI